MNDIVRVTLGMWNSTAAFMTDIPLNLLRECLHMPRNARTIEQIYDHSRFMTGTCNFWESLLKTVRVHVVREKSFASTLLKAWQFFTTPMARLPQCAKIAKKEAMAIFNDKAIPIYSCYCDQ